MKNKLLLCGFWITLLINLTRWLGCLRIEAPIHFSWLDLSLRLQEAIRTDTNTPIFLVRIVHNKPAFFIIDIFNYFIGFLSFNFLISLVSIMGLFGIFCYVVSFKKNKTHLLSLFLLVVSIFFEMFAGNSFAIPGNIILIWLPFAIVSFIGYRHFINNFKKLSYPFSFILFILSIWWMGIFNIIKLCVK